ncbi:MAG: hypothetical protein EZS28_049452, partial [Streblomastix strix]
MFFSHVFIEKPLQLQYGRHTNRHPIYRVQFSKMSKNLIKPEPPELVLFVNFDPQKLNARIPVLTKVDQLESGDEVWKFLQSEQQPKLYDIERQLTPKQAFNGRTK